ncbi:SemiSWEET family sugar transporter [Pedobacter sp. SYSU D00535]|uniref:SemiSWEET family sugar transporter n=1 Tax=Pedobacter sp. SYSU D00535 TaxID=2810308 RepID=UPI001A97165C|nr:SemiSWEET transporter [Pedobacter sp. SYSU D00535]
MKINNEVIGLVAGILTASSMLPQLIKTLKKKEADDISPFMVIILIVGTGLWSYYGVLRDDLPIIITNAFSCLLNSIMLILKFRYSRNKLSI